jgi:hypothetical protein
MADTTANRGYAYPEASDGFEPHTHIQALADDVDADMNTQVGRIQTLENTNWQEDRVQVASPVATSSSSSVGTSETVVATVPSDTYSANSCYRIEITGGMATPDSGAFAAWKIRKTNASGTILMEYPRTPPLTNTNHFELPLKPRYFKVGGSNVTTALVLTLTASSGATYIHAGAATYPRQVKIYWVGPSSYQPDAVTLS